MTCTSKFFEYLVEVVAWGMVENLSEKRAAAIECGSNSLIWLKHANCYIAHGGDKEVLAKTQTPNMPPRIYRRECTAPNTFRVDSTLVSMITITTT